MVTLVSYEYNETQKGFFLINMQKTICAQWLAGYVLLGLAQISVVPKYKPRP